MRTMIDSAYPPPPFNDSVADVVARTFGGAFEPSPPIYPMQRSIGIGHPQRYCFGWVDKEIASNGKTKYRGNCECRWSAKRCWLDLDKAVSDVLDHLHEVTQ